MKNRRLLLLQFLALFGFWMALSWRLDPLFVVMGVVFALLLTLWTSPLTTDVLHGGRPSPSLRREPVLVVRFVSFAAWLLSRIVLATFQLAWFTLHPALPLDPVELRFRTGLQRPLARAVLTNSISLVPGTLTVDMDDDLITIHALIPSSADDLISGKLQNKVAGLFDEGPQEPVRPTWVIEPMPEPGADPTDSTQHQEEPESP